MFKLTWVIHRITNKIQHFGASSICGKMQWSITIYVGNRDICATFQEQFKCLFFIVLGGPMQRCSPEKCF